MKQEDKELLLKDLCTRLPYGLNCKIYHKYRYYDMRLSGVFNDEVYFTDDNGSLYIDYENVKPYLFPLSSITEEQKKTLKVLCDWNDEEADAQSILVLYQKHFVMKTDVIDWLNENHFDYRGLIAQDLALDATGLNIY